MRSYHEEFGSRISSASFGGGQPNHEEFGNGILSTPVDGDGQTNHEEFEKGTFSTTAATVGAADRLYMMQLVGGPWAAWQAITKVMLQRRAGASGVRGRQ